MLGASAHARFVRALPFSVRTHREHPGAVCLATIPPAQNPSLLQRRKHPCACHLPQQPFDHEFSPPRCAQFLPMILPSLRTSPKRSRTRPFSSVIQRTFSYHPFYPSRPPDVLLVLFYSPSTLHTLLIRRTFYCPPDVIPTA